MRKSPETACTAKSPTGLGLLLGVLEALAFVATNCAPGTKAKGLIRVNWTRNIVRLGEPPTTWDEAQSQNRLSHVRTPLVSRIGPTDALLVKKRENANVPSWMVSASTV